MDRPAEFAQRGVQDREKIMVSAPTVCFDMIRRESRFSRCFVALTSDTYATNDKYCHKQ